MMLWHPQMQAVSCKDCRRWVFNFKEWTFPERGGKRQERTPAQPPPCKTCPREHWSREERTKLSKRNWATWQMYLRAKCGGLTDAEKEDSIVQRSLSICREIDEQYQQHLRHKEIQALLGASPAGATVGRTPQRGK